VSASCTGRIGVKMLAPAGAGAGGSVVVVAAVVDDVPGTAVLEVDVCAVPRSGDDAQPPSAAATIRPEPVRRNERRVKSVWDMG